ncbi:hypothetical protein ACIQC5_20620 [Paenarthrobacter sp. NPDC092416]|uniref:hypothetical protein n=1 Tax=Paenarthrobacter sp. NPDC092416 TaxID=3364386 RepID=UPI00380D602E
MISIIQLLVQLVGGRHPEFAAWEREAGASDLRLTSAPWVGWHEEVDDSSHFG